MLINNNNARVIHKNGSYRVYKPNNSDVYIVVHDCMLGLITIKAYVNKKCVINKCDKLATQYYPNNHINN